MRTVWQNSRTINCVVQTHVHHCCRCKARLVIVMRCRFAWVCMYVYPQIVQCNSILVYVYLQHLHNTILCSPRMYVRHACATIAQFSGQNVPGTIMTPDYCLACVASILWKNTTTSVSSPCPAHCASRMISVTL